ncbi:prostatic acid phosphatase-like isoform X1 [Plodia interpunctella]|uniref:prostatic acid phosphatase-like isoform X1 n=1 Tax=Plodia interpunctella TaxID=58824 RepID=UPI0023689E65|nr:prostatic acid phosphatase-like isoform X2 [Plodia interpunctella]
MILLLVFTALFFSTCNGDSNVQYAAVIYRHGDRTPVSFYPTDPYQNESLWPVKLGELTNIGKRQHFALGQWLRKRYSHLLSSEFEPSEIYVRSTDVDRTLMSAQSNLAGMYPPSGNSVWNQNLMWQPLPVHTEPEKEDKLLAMKKHCPKYNIALDQYVHSREYKTRLNKYQNLMNYLTAYTGSKVTDYNDINNIYDLLYIESLYNFTLPNWTREVYPDKLVEPSGYSFTTDTGTPTLARLKVGPLLQHITTQMANKVAFGKGKRNKTDINVAIFSGHDITVANVLHSLGLYNGISPVYTSTVFLELLYANDTAATPLIRISYRNSTDIVEPNILTIPKCGQLCPLERFIALYENLITVDWNYECQKQYPALLTTSVFFCFGVFVMIYVVYQLHFYRFYRQYRPDVDIRYTSVDTATTSKLSPS